MNRNTKILLGVIGGLLILCCIIGGITMAVLPMITERTIGEAFMDDPEQVAAVGQSIVSYELPSGYEEQMAMDLFGFNMVMIASADEEMLIMLMELPDVGHMPDEEELRQQMGDAFASQGGGSAQNLTLVDTEEVVINDQRVTLATYEGTDERGQEIRQVVTAFLTQRGSTAAIMIMGATAEWNEEDVDAFIRSLR